MITPIPSSSPEIPACCPCAYWGERIVALITTCSEIIAALAWRIYDFIASFFHSSPPQQEESRQLIIARDAAASEQIQGQYTVQIDQQLLQGYLQGCVRPMADPRLLHLRGIFEISSLNKIFLDTVIELSPDRRLITSPEQLEPRPLDIDTLRIHREAAPLADSINLEDSWVDATHEIRSLLALERNRIGFSGNANLIPYLWEKDFPRSRETFFYLLKETYGCALAETVIARYQLHSEEPLTWEEIRRALIGIAANVKLTDLKALFEENRKPRAERTLFCGLSLPESTAASFEDLSQEEIGELLDCFRTIPQETNPKAPIREICASDVQGSLPTWQFNCFHYDVALLQRFAFTQKRFDPNNLYLACSEHASKGLGYLELKAGMIVPLRTEQNQLAYYTVASTLMEDGLVAHLLVPINGTSPIYLNFRGTQLQPARLFSLESLQRDIDSSGIGKTVFDEHAPTLLRLVENELSSPVDLVINGHSLGAVDTQRAVAAITHAIVEADDASPWKNVRRLSATAHNPPGVERSLNDQFLEDAARLPAHLVDITYVLFHTDPMQEAGDVYLGALAKNISRKIIYLSDDNIQRLAAHSARAFTQESSFQIRVITEGEELERLLSRAAYEPTSTALVFAQRQAQNVAYYTLSGLSAAQELLLGSRRPARMGFMGRIHPAHHSFY